MNNYYVSTLGNDTTGNGSINNPWATIGKAAIMTAPGDFVYLRGGTYNTILTSAVAIVSGTAGNLITFKKYPGETPILKPTADSHIIYLYSGEKYLVFDGLTLDASLLDDSATILYGIVLAQSVGVEHIRITNCVIHDAHRGSGIGAWTNDVEIDHCTVYSCGKTWVAPEVQVHGIYGGYGDNVTIHHNTVYDCGHYGIQFYSSSRQSGVEVHHNTCYANGQNGTGGGIVVANTAAAKVYNNLSYENASEGIGTGYSSTGLLLDNNTCVSNGTNGFNIGTSGGDTDLVGRNNIAASNTTYGFWFQANSTNSHLTYCCANGNGSAATHDDGTDTSYTNEITDDPLFTNAATDDYSLQSGSPCKDTGATVAYVTDDIIGTARPQGAAYDMGAYEVIQTAAIVIPPIVNAYRGRRA